MTVFKQLLPDEVATQTLGQRLGAALGGRGVVFLEGELGAGKTTLSRGILRAMGHQGAVKSPTFTLVEPYELGDRKVYHFDLYRLEDPQELEYLGVDDYFPTYHAGDSDGHREGQVDNQLLCLVEWPNKGAGHLPPYDLLVELLVLEQGRQCIITSNTEWGDAVCRALLESV
jgi:tRNA threonylcarbamoyladenosine biosynthesis protein TsaE